MCFIPKHYARFFNRPIYVINRQARFQYVILCNKNNIRLYKVLIIITWLCYICIQQAAVISGPLNTGSLITSLDFNIIHPSVFVSRYNIQTDGTSLQILYIMLGVYLLNA